MKKFKILIDIFHGRDRVETRAFTVEAGNKKMATIRALSEVSKIKEFASFYKSVKSVEEVNYAV